MPGKIRGMSPFTGESSHREHDPREMLLRSAGKLFQDVGYVQASIHRIADAVSAHKGTFYNYFRSKEELASILVDRQFTAINQSLSMTVGKSARDQLNQHFEFLATEPPTVEVAPLQLLATFAAEAPAIPFAITQTCIIARGTDLWITHVSDLISYSPQTESCNTNCPGSQKLASLLVTLLVRSDCHSQEIGHIF